jgi:hypothetical protein
MDGDSVFSQTRKEKALFPAPKLNAAPAKLEIFECLHKVHYNLSLCNYRVPA